MCTDVYWCKEIVYGCIQIYTGVNSWYTDASMYADVYRCLLMYTTDILVYTDVFLCILILYTDVKTGFT